MYTQQRTSSVINCKFQTEINSRVVPGWISEEPHWVEVLTEVLLSLLTRPSSLFRHVVDQVFTILAPHLTRNALTMILEVSAWPVYQNALNTLLCLLLLLLLLLVLFLVSQYVEIKIILRQINYSGTRLILISPAAVFWDVTQGSHQRNSLGGALRDNPKNGCGDTKGTCHSVRIKRALWENVRSTFFIDVKTKADNFTRKRYFIS